MEAKGLLRVGHELGVDEAAADEVEELCGEPLARCRGGERGERLAREVAADERGALGGVSYLCVEQVEPGSEESLDGRGNGFESGLSSFLGVGEQLFRQQHVPLRELDKPRAHGDLEPAFERGDDRADVVVAQAVEGERPRLPRRALIEQLRSRRADDEHRLSRPLDQLIDEIEQPRLDPVEGLEHDDERTEPASDSSRRLIAQNPSSTEPRPSKKSDTPSSIDCRSSTSASARSRSIAPTISRSGVYAAPSPYETH